MSENKRIFHISNRVVIPDGNGSAGGLDETISAPPSGYEVVRFGWSGKVIPDNEFDKNGAVHTVTQDGVVYITLNLKKSEFEGFYNGFSNGVLWPLFHFRPDLVAFNKQELNTYIQVNKKFAEIAAEFIEPHDVVLVHDYHLIPCGHNLRERGISHPMGFFLHIPLPDDDLLGSAPAEILDYDQRRKIKGLFEYLSAYNMVGLQTPQDLTNLHSLVAGGPTPALPASMTAAPILSTTDTFNRSSTHFGVFPAMGQTLRHAHTAEKAAFSQDVENVISKIGHEPDIVALDRLDYSKGLVPKLRGYLIYLIQQQQGLSISNNLPHLFQVAAAGREGVKAYQNERTQIEAIADTICQIYGDEVLHLDTNTIKRDVMLGLFRRSNVGLITPLRDGMNVTAFEYLGAQDESDPGVLVLSKYAGAATVLSDSAVLVDPRDPYDIANGIQKAKTMPLEDRQERLENAMSFFKRHTNQTWLQSIVDQTIKASAAPQ